MAVICTLTDDVMAFKLAILGRPNVGKSTLFNYLTGRRVALVDPTPGLTRDRREGEAELGGLAFTVVDTAGYEEGDAESLSGRMWQQTETALAESDAALLLVDARVGITPADKAFVRILRSSQTPVILVANKCEGAASDAGYYDAFSLGLGEPVAISAEHRLGMGELHVALQGLIGAERTNVGESSEGNRRTLRLAIIGRPNVGKSTLVNRLVGEPRVITGPEPGLTRDSIAVAWDVAGRWVELIDTAGLRRKSKTPGRLEQMMAAETRRAAAAAQVVLLLLDASEPMARADLSAATFAIDEGRALVIALNKWDLVRDGAMTRRELSERLLRSLPQVRGVPVISFSALDGGGTETLMPAVMCAYDVWNTRIATGPLNRWLAEAVARQPPPAARGRRNRLRYATQSSVRPPTFVLFASQPRALPDSWVRYAINDLRETFGLPGVPIRVTVRRSRDTRAA